MKTEHHEIGVGATEALNLRVSVAALVRVLFEDSADTQSTGHSGALMLALERRATLEAGVCKVMSQPFGGGLRILDLAALRASIGEFRFDSERSRKEQDFRILVQPSAWQRVRAFCLEHLDRPGDPVLETGPERELVEEFAEALGIELQPDQYDLKPIGILVENDPVPTKNARARGIPTSRIYRIFEARIIDRPLGRLVTMRSESISDQQLGELALKDARNGGRGRASSVLVLPLGRLTAHYSASPPAERSTSMFYEKCRLDETVAAILDGVTVPRYGRQ